MALSQQKRPARSRMMARVIVFPVVSLAVMVPPGRFDCKQMPDSATTIIRRDCRTQAHCEIANINNGVILKSKQSALVKV